MDPASLGAVVGWIVLHLVGLASAFATRVAEGSCLERLAQVSFFALMATIGATTWVCQRLDVGWTWSAITLVAMVLTAVTDFRRTSEPAHPSFGR